MENKNVLVCVCGGIAAYKACEVVSRLRKAGVNVYVIMTKNAVEFVSPLTFETLSKNPVACDMFADKPHFEVEHISLAKKADAAVVVPATANVIAKLAHGIADDMLTTTLLACRCKIVVCPGMNTGMYESPITLENMCKLKDRGYTFVESETGLLACGDVGKGRLAEPPVIVDAVLKQLASKNDYSGKRVLVTAGATCEPIDGVRYITNRSSGKMGFAVADAARRRGAEVTVIAGRTTAPRPHGIEYADVLTTGDMYDKVMSMYSDFDVIIKAAAPADYRPKSFSRSKIKAATLTVEFEKNPDIAASLGKVKGDRKLVIFCAETEGLKINAAAKLKAKNADMIVANDVTLKGAGFDCDTNIATIIDKNGATTDCELCSKSTLADIILDKILEL